MADIFNNSSDAVDLNNPNTLDRVALTSKVIDLFDRSGVVLVKSPPMTGKTMLGYLVTRALITRKRRQGRKDVVVNLTLRDVPKSTPFETWFEKCGATFEEVLSWACLQRYAVYIVVDEAQRLYRKTGCSPPPRIGSFWRVVKAALDRQVNIKVLMLASYDRTPMCLVSSPADIDSSLVFGIEDMNFTLDEIKGFVNKCFKGRACLQGDPLHKFQSRLAMLTGGHVGLCATAIGKLNEVFDTCQRNGAVTPSAEEWIRMVELGFQIQYGENDLATALRSTRALQVVEGLNPFELELLKGFLCGAVDREDFVVKKCIYAGILVETWDGNIEFSSAAMWGSVASLCIGRIKRAPVWPTTLQEMIVRTVRAINYDRMDETLEAALAQPIGARVRSSLEMNQQVERAWQMAFLHALYSSTPSDCVVAAVDFGAIFGSPGFIDFTVQQGDELWGIGQLRGSSMLDERSSHLTNDAKVSLELTDYCLVDFRVSPEEESTVSDLKMHDKLFIVCYDSEMRNVQLRSRESTWNVLGLTDA